MSQQQRNKKLHQEGRILLAIQAIKSGQIKSVRSAARIYDVPQTTLAARMAGRVARRDSHKNQRKLTETEEKTLRAWLIDMDNRGYPLTVANTRAAAQQLLSASIGHLAISFALLTSKHDIHAVSICSGQNAKIQY